jgi:hypothetical protein
MTDNVESEVTGEAPEALKNEATPVVLPPEMEELFSKKIEENLKPIKEKLDSAYGARDEALRRVAEYEQKEREAEKARLKEQGKLEELYEMQLAEERARAETLKKKNIELTRDISVRNVLATMDFRNDRALESAYKDIVDQLVQNEQGEWVHRSGASIRDYVKAFAEQEENSFFFKPKVSTGSGGSSPSTTPASTSGKKSLFQMDQAQVIELARQGKLPGQT